MLVNNPDPVKIIALMKNKILQKTENIKITPLQKYLIEWGLQSIRYENDSQIKSARNLAYKLDLDIKINY